MSTNEPFAIVGLTGGIASGKTTVSEMFKELGVEIIDADEIAREVVEPGEPAYEDIREHFGEAVIADDGRLDREALGEVVFEDSTARSRLESITHPRIAQRMQQKAMDARQAGERWVVYDAALIVENDLHHALDSLIVVSAARETQIERIRERDALPRAEAEARLDAQMPLDRKLEAADYVVDNDGALEETRRQVESLFRHLDRAMQRVGTTDPEELMSDWEFAQNPEM